MRRAHLLCCFSIGLALFSPAPAYAESDAIVEAVAAWDEAIDAWERGEYPMAEARFQRSYELHPTGRTACDFGRLLRLMGHSGRAAAWFARCAADEALPEQEREVARAQALHLQSLTGGLVIRGGPQGARVLIDGEIVGTVPLQRELALSSGEHALEIVGGGQRISRLVEVLPGQRVTVDAEQDAPTAEAPSVHVAPMWSLWTMLSLSLVSLAGTAAGYGLDVAWSASDSTRERAETAALASAIAGGIGGASLAVTLVLLPYVLAGREEARLAGNLELTRPEANGFLPVWAW